ncbi:transcriptional regulator with XRE-family HTH domain [Croceifilum oryzae]|uniref:Transcriptional regulator with XRE-family HTH domain n=1 Tax=Croceifilum oryzae TaxID=1553429 RepID=A0AAJ1TJ55_9BACL|nr:helix-turn-helix transcriptional regulator [Croceifilum oryzae]MDQ0417892.1 transcriptional regulator with XRE-family HTH domain [Croceifilum oryzae]
MLKQEILETFAKRVSLLRKDRRWSQKDLAEKIGGNVTLQIISNWERAYTRPEVEDIFRTAEVLEVSVDFLLGKTDDPAPQHSENPAHNIVDLKKALLDESALHWDGHYIKGPQKDLIQRLVLAVIEKEMNELS